MLIKFNAKRILGFEHPKLKGGKIIPGVQDIHDDVVLALLGDSIQVLKFESGELEAIDGAQLGALRVKRVKGKALAGLDILLAADEMEAKKMAMKTVDMDLLTRWAKKETRKGVRSVLIKQIQKIRDVKFRKDENTSEVADEGDDF